MSTDRSEPRKWSSADDRSTSVVLTGRAARWLQLLQDFGHIDTEMADQILIFVADIAAKEHEAELRVNPRTRVSIDLVQIRRAAALLVARDLEDAPQLPMVLEEDWPLFFS